MKLQLPAKVKKRTKAGRKVGNASTGENSEIGDSLLSLLYVKMEHEI